MRRASSKHQKPKEEIISDDDEVDENGFEAWLYKNKTLFESKLNTAINRQTRSFYPISPEMRKKAFSLDETFELRNIQKVDCSNIDGIQEIF